MTADQCGGDDKSHSSKFADGTAKACEIQRYSRQKTAQQRNKIASIVFCAAHGRKHQMLVDTPSPEMTAQRSKNKRLTPKYIQRRLQYGNRKEKAWQTTQAEVI